MAKPTSKKKKTMKSAKAKQGMFPSTLHKISAKTSSKTKKKSSAEHQKKAKQTRVYFKDAWRAIASNPQYEGLVTVSSTNPCVFVVRDADHKAFVEKFRAVNRNKFSGEVSLFKNNCKNNGIDCTEGMNCGAKIVTYTDRNLVNLRPAALATYQTALASGAIGGPQLAVAAPAAQAPAAAAATAHGAELLDISVFDWDSELQQPPPAHGYHGAAIGASAYSQHQDGASGYWPGHAFQYQHQHYQHPAVGGPPPPYYGGGGHHYGGHQHPHQYPPFGGQGHGGQGGGHYDNSSSSNNNNNSSNYV